jgi:sulfate permease, SulP family
VPAAALLIAASQLPTAVGAQPPAGSLLSQAIWTLAHVASWEPAATVLTIAVLIAIFAGRLIHPLFPGVLLATAAAIAFSLVTGYSGERVGALAVGLPPISLELPWSATPALLFGGAVIALVGFAEPASIARQFASEDRSRWDPDREFLSQGAANVAAGLTGGFPVGGSFSRSSLNRLAGARSRLSGAVTGVAVLAVLPFATVLSPLPSAVLGAIVIAAVIPLIRLRPIARLWRVSRPQFLLAAATFALTLALSPQIDRAVLAGIALSIAVHLWRELRIDARVWDEGGVLNVRPQGVVWFGVAQALHDRFSAELAAHPDAQRVVLHLDGIGRLDVSGALVMRAMLDEAHRGGLETEIVNVDPRDRRLIDGVVEQERDPVAG